MDHELKEEELEFLKSRVNEIINIETILQAKKGEVGSIIELICRQNHLEGIWGLNLNKQCLLKQEEEKE